MVVHVAIALKADQGKEMLTLQAAKAVAAQLEHREQILAATKEENNRLEAELDRARHIAQQLAYLEACIVAAMTLAAEKEAKVVEAFL